MSDGTLHRIVRREHSILAAFIEAEQPEEIVYEIGADYLLGRARDEIGIERVQVWELERTGAPSVIGLAPKPAGSPRIP